ncbi:GTPase HflX [Spirochaeta lutea]|uniref:GTPase HflX n=1 Tax=Spirochaeta lutea TaxID=1480694 RepID=A0A098R1X5_9SPIO|nr:GTPase HflX [Spirochaeta lutea]KGE73668.1 hypothetical protein DC28_01540 [Spirochaeta lutea]
MIEHTTLEPDRAFLVGIQDPGENPGQAKAHLEELIRLTETMGAQAVANLTAKISDPNPKLILGTGKADEIIQAAEEAEADILIIDSDLSPSQQRNWERLSGLPVLDRQLVILEIFAQRAQTKEARLQVDLARYEYALPRLTRAWTHLGRQRGGTRGTRGEGEKQIEADRRIIEARIAKIKQDLQQVQKQRATLRKGRESVPVPTAALVGYTNAGKSSLLKTLTQAEILVEDKLFATLDPTTRRFELGDGLAMLLTDTVGFIRKLPHGLVDAFRSTLEETTRADLLIHLADASNPEVIPHLTTTETVLQEIGATAPRLLVFNKIDAAPEATLTALQSAYPEAVCISAITGQGLDLLAQELKDFLRGRFQRFCVLLPFAREDLVALAHRSGVVEEKKYQESGIHLQGTIPERLVSHFEPYKISQDVI